MKFMNEIIDNLLVRFRDNEIELHKDNFMAVLKGRGQEYIGFFMTSSHKIITVSKAYTPLSTHISCNKLTPYELNLVQPGLDHIAIVDKELQIIRQGLSVVISNYNNEVDNLTDLLPDVVQPILYRPPFKRIESWENILSKLSHHERATYDRAEPLINKYAAYCTILK